MRELKDILYKVAIKAVFGTTERAVSALHFDSRKVEKGCLYLAQKGVVADGHDYIDAAVEAGAVCVVCEKMPELLNPDVSYVQVAHAQSALAVMASNFYENPSSEIKLIGITGTNGKTTIATLLFDLFTKLGFKSGLLSTVKVVVGDVEYKATHTTPDSVQINYYLRMMADQGVSHCFMEVSSHGIHQKRTEGLQFAGGVFTNLTHDHLDYHGDFKAYRDVKKSFFDALPKSAFALVNADDKNGMVMMQNTKAEKVTYALKSMADYRAKVLENQFSGLLLHMSGQDVWTRLIGSFNAYNLLAIYGVARMMGIEETQALTGISTLESVSGRFQYFVSQGGVRTIVDYAHTPDALKNVLETINDIRTGSEKVITVVGCGGDRDKAKRPVMGRIAALLSTQVIFTSDNPRSEEPSIIIKEMEEGVAPENFNRTLAIEDRAQAIKTAIRFGKKNDIILIAGKGHENYQEVKGKRTHFDDLEMAATLFKAIEK